MLYCNTTMIK